MSISVSVNAHINTRKLAYQFRQLADDYSMVQVHNLFAKMCDPYVPMETGTLSQGATIYKDKVVWPGPYGRYMYMGEVYGPNIPIFEDGVLVGFFSPPGQKKKPTGRDIQYNKEYHPLASKEWDKAMMRDRGDEFLAQVEEILLQRCKALYG